jgi:hypothetical protein
MLRPDRHHDLRAFRERLSAGARRSAETRMWAQLIESALDTWYPTRLPAGFEPRQRPGTRPRTSGTVGRESDADS